MKVRRFAFSWLFLVLLLTGTIVTQTYALDRLYREETGADGGVYTEALEGEFTNFSPLFAVSTSDTTVSKLVFSGLFERDKNGQLQPDMAESISRSDRGNEYTVVLRPNLKWHDGTTLNSADVVYTVNAIKNPETDSPYRTVWEGITVKAVDETTVQFILPNAFAPFQEQLTVGIVPAHLLQDQTFGGLRTSEFNVSPVGSGPFKFSEFSAKAQRVELVKNMEYYLGVPRLDSLILRAFEDQQAMIRSYRIGESHGVYGVEMSILTPEEQQQARLLTQYSGVYAFFNVAQEPLDNSAVRNALQLALNSKKILEATRFENQLLNSAILPELIGYNKKLTQNTDDLKKAEATIQADGWAKNADGIYQKEGAPLKVTVHTSEDEKQVAVTRTLAETWNEFGVQTEVINLSNVDLQRNVRGPRNFEVLVSPILIGNDPDVFAYWHSSQVGSEGLNFSNYEDATADESLEAGRTRTDVAIRRAKYETFLRKWLKDAPALGLYRPNQVYLQKSFVRGSDIKKVVFSQNRLNDISQWTINEQKSLRLESKPE